MADDTPTNETPDEETPATEETPAAEETPAPEAEEAPAEEPVAEEPVAEEEPAAEAEAEPETPREKPAIPGADLEVDLVLDGEDRSDDPYAVYDEDGELVSTEEDDVVEEQPVAATISLAADARYTATGKRKTSVARVILKPGTGAYTISG